MTYHVSGDVTSWTHPGWSTIPRPDAQDFKWAMEYQPKRGASSVRKIFEVFFVIPNPGHQHPGFHQKYWICCFPFLIEMCFLQICLTTHFIIIWDLLCLILQNHDTKEISPQQHVLQEKIQAKLRAKIKHWDVLTLSPKALEPQGFTSLKIISRIPKRHCQGKSRSHEIQIC